MHFILANINAINKLKFNVNWNQNESFKKLILNPKISKDEDKQVSETINIHIIIKDFTYEITNSYD
jgi:hypothetical protein